MSEAPSFEAHNFRWQQEILARRASSMLPATADTAADHRRSSSLLSIVKLSFLLLMSTSNTNTHLDTRRTPHWFQSHCDKCCRTPFFPAAKGQHKRAPGLDSRNDADRSAPQHILSNAIPHSMLRLTVHRFPSQSMLDRNRRPFRVVLNGHQTILVYRSEGIISGSRTHDHNVGNSKATHFVYGPSFCPANPTFGALPHFLHLQLLVNSAAIHNDVDGSA